MTYRDGFTSVRREIYWTLPRLVGVIAALAVISIIIGFTVQGADFVLYRFWAPKFEDARRHVFENTKSYNQGMIQELQNMQFQYEQADDEHKAALAAIILHRAADFDEDKFPPDLRAFIHSLRRIAR